MRRFIPVGAPAALILCSALLAGCAGFTSESHHSADRGAIQNAISSPDRPAADLDEDERRRPAEVLEFLGARPGMRVVDYLAAAGYYSELLARTVGPQGRVIAYNNEAYDKFVADKIAARYANNRLPNVEQLTAAPESAPFAANSLDGALFVQSLHDLYWRAKDNSWPTTDPSRALTTLVGALKSGAAVVVVDHVAVAGADPAVSVDAMHRIDPEIIKRDLTKAGLVFEAESNAFRNRQDDHTKPVFDPSIRHRTDQVMYRFRKP